MSDQLQKLVKKAVQEVKQEQWASKPQHSTSAACTTSSATIVPIQLDNCAALNAFVQQVLNWAEQRDIKQDIQQGRIQFSLSPNNDANCQTSSSQEKAGQEIMLAQGVLTETWLKRHVQGDTKTIKIGPKVVITPAAKDQLQQLKLDVQRTKVKTKGN